MSRSCLSALSLLLVLLTVNAREKILWKVKGAPNVKREHCGYKMASSSKLASHEVYHASTKYGTYNHAVCFYNSAPCLSQIACPHMPASNVSGCDCADGTSLTDRR